MLKIDNLSYRYPSRKQFTLKNINLTLADGEMLLLAGRSGCGKSTLIKAVSGLLGSEERGELQGAIYLQGEDISKWPPEKQASWLVLCTSRLMTSFCDDGGR